MLWNVVAIDHRDEFFAAKFDAIFLHRK